MAIFLIDLPPSDMERRLGDALTVYVDAMRYPRGTETLRAPMWLEHIRRRGWQAVAAVEVTAAEQAEAADTTALPSAAELSNAPMLANARSGVRLSRGARPVVATAGGTGLATQRLSAPSDRPTDDQLLRVD